MDATLPERPLRLRVKIPRSHRGIRLDVFLSDLAGISTEAATALVRLGVVCLNSETVSTPSLAVQQDQRLFVNYLPKTAASHAGDGIRIVQQMDDCLVVSKPAGIPVQPTPEGRSNSVTSKLQKQGFSPHVVHRLDLPVSGLLAVATSQVAAGRLTSAFMQGNVRKVYLALVSPQKASRAFPDLSDDSTITISAGLQWRTADRRAVVAADGRPSTSRVTLVDSSHPYPLVAIHLVTGRTHQIRAHLSDIGIPVVGDRKYSGPAAHIGSRIALHATSLKVPGMEPDSELTELPGDDFWSCAEMSAPVDLSSLLSLALLKLFQNTI
jgi:23S rRNA pseudouridine1911/1915/1917 synthase